MSLKVFIDVKDGNIAFVKFLVIETEIKTREEKTESRMHGRKGGTDAMI